MDNPTGKIQAFVSDEHGTRAIVDIDVVEVCPRCAAGKGCGAGLLASGDRIRQVEASMHPDLNLAEGDLVEIALAPSNLLRAALIVYGLPMLGAVVAAAAANAWSLGDASAAMAALFGLAAGIVLGRWRLRKEACLRDFVPTIEKRLGEGV
ncbi:MAG: SoxR reducing system RseC family protein [Proteobacteria bacterium]|nr:SoxR reducing system RseC family protein [Pseudomonadota bacterium]